MEAHPSPSPALERSLRLPGVVPIVLIYAVCLGIGLVPQLFVAATWTQSFWNMLPFSIFANMVPIALFLAAFVAYDKRAFLIPIGGVFASALILHYLRYTPAEFESQFANSASDFAQLRSDLWEATKYSLPVGLLVTALALYAARWWSPPQPSDPTRTMVPPIKPAVIFFAVCLVPFATLGAVSARAHLFVFEYPYSIVSTTANEFALIALFCICAIALRPWTVLLPLAFVAVDLALVLTQPYGCFGNNEPDCWKFAVDTLKYEFIAMMLIFLVAVIAGIWANDEGAPAEDAPPEIGDVEPAV